MTLAPVQVAPDPPHDSRTAHLPGIDGVRAIAALCVVGVHVAFVSGFTEHGGIGAYTARLEIGVPVFFVLSGFLLYRPFAVAHLGGPPVAVGPFWAKRLRRIVPAYWLAFAVSTYLLGVGHVRSDWWSPLVYLGFAQIYSPHYLLTGLTQAWSLCTEMSFYLSLPLWAALVLRRGRRRPISWTPAGQVRFELSALAVVIVVSTLYRALCVDFGGPWFLTMLNWLPGYADLFAAGMAMALISAHRASGGGVPRILVTEAFPWISWAVALGAFVTVSNIGIPLVPLYTATVRIDFVRQTLYGIFALALVAPVIFGPPGGNPIGRLLRSPLVAGLGIVSYGVYLWHTTWIVLLLRWSGDRPFRLSTWWYPTGVVACSVATATASWWGLERRIVRPRRSRRASS